MIQIPVAGLKKNSGINIPIAGLPVAPALPNTNLGLPPIGGVRTTTPVVMPEGVPSLLQFAKKLPETLLPATTEFAKTTGAIFGEGLAYLIDPEVKKQYLAGNLEVLPTITKTSLAGLAKKTGGQMIEATVLKLLPPTLKQNIYARFGQGALEGLGFAISEGLAKDYTPEQVIDNVKNYGAVGGAIYMVSPYLGRILKAKPSELPQIAKEFGGEITQPIKELTQKIEKDLIAKGYTPAEAKIMATQRGSLGEAPKKKLPVAQKALPEAITAEKGIIPQELEPLAREARKYKSAEEFIRAIGSGTETLGRPGELYRFVEPFYPKLEKAGFVDEWNQVGKSQFTDFYNQAVKGMGKVKALAESIPQTINEFNKLPFEKQTAIFDRLSDSLKNQIMETGEVLKESLKEGGSPLERIAAKIANGELKLKVIPFEKTEFIERMGKDNYMRIFRNDNTLQGIDDIASEVNVTTSELRDAIENALRHRKDLTKSIIEEKEFLASIKSEAKGIELERNTLRKQIGLERDIRQLSGTVLSRIKEKNGIKEWSNATKEQLQNVLDDFKNLQKGDEMISRSQVESLKEFGLKNWTAKREAAEILGDVANWKSRTARFFDFFQTIEQKIEKTAGKDAERVKDILTRPRAKAVTEMIKEEITLKTGMRDMLDNLKVNSGKDRALIMRFGEKRMTLEELKKATPQKWQQIIEADRWFRKNYDELLDTANAEMKRLGYSDDKLIPKRQDYYTHSQEIGKLWELAKAQGGDINPVLEQISEFTRPNRKFNPFGLKRLGGREFVEDAGKAFEAYLTPTLNNKHLTESIIRHRAVADILAHKTLQTKNINQFIFSLRDAADSLTGKTNPFDRALMNRVLGRKPIQIISWMSNRFAKNRIIGNVGSALMQISGVPNSVLKNNIIRTTKGLLTQAVSPLLGKNDPLLKSQFLLRRYGEKGLQHGESVFPSFIKKGEKVASIPFELIEKNITKALWRASFDNAWSQGFRGLELMQKADEITMSIVGARRIGERALAFESGVLSLPLQFQLEVNTSAQMWKSQVFDKLFKNPVQALRAGVEASITLYLMNTLFDKTMGRTPLPDPIRAIGDVSQADNWAEGVGRIVGEAFSNVAGGQFIAGLLPEDFKKKYFGRSEVGIYPGGIPIATAIAGGFRNPSNFVYDIVLPYGGGQLKKILQGVEGLDKMGSYNKSGKLQFPINQNQWLQVVLFGKYSTEEAKEYFDKQRTVLSDKQTIEYFLRTRKGENPQAVYQDVIKNRIRKEYEREIIKEVVKKIKSNPTEGLALIQLWKKENIITEEMEKKIIDQLK